MERLLKSRLKHGRFITSPERSRSMAAVRGKGNKTTELRLRMALVKAGIKGWSLHRDDLPGKPDFYFEKQAIAVLSTDAFGTAAPNVGTSRKPITSSGRPKSSVTANVTARSPAC
jgi:G:T-mismatch repair DNA endonuclease (very short patch repair protein)